MMQQIYHKLQSGTPEELQSKYSLHDGFIFYEVRVVISKTLQELALKELYNTQMGMTKNESFGEQPLFLGKELMTTLKRW
jgi:hypothetical protein